MKQYVIRCHIEHVLVVEAETEVDAREQASRAQFNDWEHYPSDYNIESATSPGPKPADARRPTRTASLRQFLV